MNGFLLRNSIAAVVLFLVLICLSGCIEMGSMSETGSLTGYVVLTEPGTANGKLAIGDGLVDGGPIADALITVSGCSISARTDVTGQFLISGLRPGKYSLTISHSRAWNTLTLDEVQVSAASITSVGTTKLGRGHYLFIGVSDYALNYLDLRSPEDDVDSLKSCLVGPSAASVRVLKSSAATKGGIRQAIRDLGKAVRPADHFVFFFSGHGGVGFSGPLLGLEFIIPHDGNPGVGASMITDRELTAWLREYIATDNVTVVLDSCNSGAFANGYMSKSLLSHEYALAGAPTPLMKAIRSTPYVLLAAAGEAEDAYESNGGALTQALVEALGSHRMKADADSDRTVTARELWAYASEWCVRHSWAHQHPYLWPEPSSVHRWPPVLRY